MRVAMHAEAILDGRMNFLTRESRVSATRCCALPREKRDDQCSENGGANPQHE